jgi:hypothetical protein
VVVAVSGGVANDTDQPRQIAALDGVVRGRGGVTRACDRIGTVVAIGTDRVLPSFAEVAKHYAAEVRICPAYPANRKSVEKSNHFIAQRWWRTRDVATPAEAQASLDVFLAGRGDPRVRHVDGRRITVGGVGDTEPLRAAPARAFPARADRGDRCAGRDGGVRGQPLRGAPSLIGHGSTASSRTAPRRHRA